MRRNEADVSRQEQIGNTVVLFAYVALVHTVDTLAHHGTRFLIDWSVFRWQLANGFDLFEFLVWFVIPFLFSLRRLDPAWFGVGRWKRLDWAVLGGLCAAAILAVISIPLFPSLRATYTPFEEPAEAFRAVVWTFSWLVGWEFLHRYVLLNHAQTRWPRFGWLIVPLVEGLYHLQKDWPETAGMIALSLVVTPWTARRRNVLLPFLAHLMVELTLITFMSGPLIWSAL